MYRNSPVRNQRAKGVKVKNVLQVCLLVAVCFWLIFQLKRSHDKRKEFDASDGKVSLSTLARNSEEIAKLGRKDLQPKFEKTGNEGEGDGHEQEEEEVQDERDENKLEEEEQDEHDENKHEEEEQDEDKIEEEKDDGRDDEIDENEQEKLDVEIDREEVDVVGEEKETEESDEKENENEDVSEEKDGQSQTENEVSSVEHNEDSATEHTHEAREENYKADDASSAVTHTGRTLGTENEIKNGTIAIVALSENVGQTAENGTSTSPNTTVIQGKDPEPVISNVSPTSSIDSNENGPPSDTTLFTSQSTETQNITEVTEVSSNSTDISNSEVTESNESSSDPSKAELETETNNVTEVTEATVDPDEVQHDPIDSTDSTHLEEKDVRTDLDTLPDIVTEGGNSEDTAAE
ncbi:hypothetical protein CTI12_AA275130 [Artemisia annua]|uniref:Uncharacterized protein n=1 Tax=Artemisia annua TaxID=35608 RepID=A0A2U1NEC4_ARTAN|nr:hypothetical protein CTI12_AA275130 [Artemisia annua]